MKLASPVFRLSFSLVLLTTSILLVSDMLGLVPDRRAADLEARKAISEALAVQLSVAVADKHRSTVVETLNAVKARNRQIRSVALHTAAGDIIAFAGDHSTQWKPPSNGKSTATDVQVPIFRDGQPWGRVEIHFAPLAGGETWFGVPASILTVIGFVALAGFLVYVLFLKRSLHELDPSAVVPHRVREALDALAEGLLIIDQRERIVLANSAFERRLGYPVETLLGRPVSELGWEFDSKAGPHAQLPWVKVLQGDKASTNVSVRLITPLQGTLAFVVNATAIDDGQGRPRGVLATFDDVTELERKNGDLQRALAQLEQTKRAITLQNQELQVLATRDPLSGCLNRRSLFEGLRTAFDEAQRDASPLSCIMADIDHFKSINDRFGHATGDEVIKMVAETMTACARSTDLVSRYGGEEFCMILPGVGIDGAYAVAERMRQAVHDAQSATSTSAIRITSSFGVATLRDATPDPAALIDCADKALYLATRWCSCAYQLASVRR